jgi:hypothetical protein
MIDARNAVEAAGITINGLAINTTDFPNLDEYYEDYVITSDGFVIPAEGFEDFGRAVGRKITQEVTGEIPVPAAVWLLGSGLLGLAGLRLRRR